MTSTSSLGTVEVPFGRKKKSRPRRKRTYTIKEAADELLADPDALRKK